MSSKRRSFLVPGAVASLLLCGANLWAHPSGHATVNSYTKLRVDSARIDVRLVVDFAEVPTFQERRRIDLDRDGLMSEAELVGFLDSAVAEYPGRLVLSVDGVRSALRVRSQRISTPTGDAGLPTLRVELDLEGAFSAGGRHFVFENRLHRDRNGWHELWVSAVPGQAIYDSTVYGSPLTDELRDYPEEPRTAPLNERRGQFSRTAGTIPPGASPLRHRDTPSRRGHGQHHGHAHTHDDQHRHHHHRH